MPQQEHAAEPEEVANEMADLDIDAGAESGSEDVDYAPPDIDDDFVYDPNAQW